MLDHTRESKRFDPDGNYVRAWLPVLARLPVKYIHRCAAAAASLPLHRPLTAPLLCSYVEGTIGRLRHLNMM